VGRFGDVKGSRELAAALPMVAERVAGARFVVAGGLPENRKAEARWRRRMPLCAGRVELPGWLEPRELEARYAAARVLMAPSWHETFGFAVAEAMARGLAVVASDAGGLSELVEHEVTGLLVPPRDPEALAAALVTTLADPSRASAIGQEAQRRARSLVWSERIPAWVEVLRSVGGRASKNR
jgi:glycogen(starch) synthase